MDAPTHSEKQERRAVRSRPGKWNGYRMKVLKEPVIKASRSRTALPLALEHATAFSRDPNLDGFGWIVTFASRFPNLFGQALNDAHIDRQAPNKRGSGSWLLARLAYTAFQNPCVKTFWRNSHEAFWIECGFEKKPKLLTCYERFREFEEEEMTAVLERLAATLVQKAVKGSGGLVGEHVHIDSTQSQTNAQFIHACPDDGSCTREDTRVSKGKDALRRSATAPTSDVNDDRHDSAETPADEVAIDLPLVGEADDFKNDKGYLYLQIGGCWWRSRDKDAGARAYRKGKRAVTFWTGYYNAKAIDHFTGGAIYLHDTSASVNEAKSFPDVLAGTEMMLGKNPKTVTTDRGYALAECVRECTERGIAQVCDFRAPNHHQPNPVDDDDLDADNIPRCSHCGSECRLVRFHSKNRKPRLWLECTLEASPDCRRTCKCPDDCKDACCKTGTCDPYDTEHPCKSPNRVIQTRYCQDDWLRLRPLWPTHESYQALLDSHREYERVHQHFRQRWCVAGDSFASRLRRIGLPAQRVQGLCALVLQWAQILDREGWLGSDRRNTGAQVEHHGWLAVKILRARRLEAGRTMPYGPNAVALGIGPLRPEAQIPDPLPDGEPPGSGPPSS